jgi:hypothetical protein
MVTTPNGFKYKIGAEKLGGNYTYGYFVTATNKEYNVTDLGYYEVPGILSNYAFLQYTQFKPWKFIREGNCRVNLDFNRDYATGKIGNNSVSFNSFINLLSFNALFAGGSVQLERPYDYFEARTDGRIYHGLRYFSFYAGVSSDYRKPLAIDYTFNTSNFLDQYKGEGYGHDLSFRIRPSDKLFIIYKFSYNFDPANVGYATDAGTDTIKFGSRRLDTYTNELNCSYIFNRNMSLSVIGRHYWITGEYTHYYNLQENGELIENESYAGKNDFNFNVLNLDVVYRWRFAPGSDINIIYKKGIQNEVAQVNKVFTQNFSDVLNSPQTTIFTVKVLYFLDYQQIVRKRNKS